ncbi:hypothetical protein [Paractinoplanes brasiliensis]|uniref:hypothetical protein n=1 Tax=Paractinoplanes brasiliensis TaxID=52695 RepID=UPI00105BEEE2|nr:hypothetical protein [Actinoplanes brasiliensis]
MATAEEQPRKAPEQHDQPLHRGDEPETARPTATEEASGGGALPSPEQGFLQRLDQRPGLTALVALSTFAALAIGVLAAVPDWRDMLAGDEPAAAPPATSAAAPTSSAAPRPTGPRVIDLVVRDSELNGDPNDVNTGLTRPAVEFTLLNRAAQRSVTTRVLVTVEESIVVEQCGSQGGALTVSGAYDVELPLRPAPGTVLKVPVSQQQAADEADRFALRFTTAPRQEPTTIHLYRLTFELLADGNATGLPAGTAVVSVPDAPSGADAYFMDEDREKRLNNPDPDSYQYSDEEIACLKGNSTVLKEFLNKDAELSPDMAQAKAEIKA